MSAASRRVRRAPGSTVGHGSGGVAIGLAARFGVVGAMESWTPERERKERGDERKKMMAFWSKTFSKPTKEVSNGMF